MYQNLAGLLAEAEERGIPLWEVVLEGETALTGLDREAVFLRLEERYGVMRRSAEAALEKALDSGLIAGYASRHSAYAEGGGILDPFVNRMMARALSGCEVNASMGRICAAPTAGACGILPAVLMGMEERYGLDRRAALEGLLTASGVGAVIARNATVSGAEAGCQAECGAAAAMAAAAAVQMAGGTPAQAVNAAALALVNCMGLVCDPVAGLVQVPCAQRNASQAVNALLSADLALGGMESPVPPDQVVEAMAKVGKLLPPQLRETARGGIAATPAGKATARRLFGEGGSGAL